MAERSNATAKKSPDGGLDVSALQKRGRRRLVGAIALVLLAVIVLPMVFDPEPKPNAAQVNIRIPAEDGGKFTPREATGARVMPAPEAQAKPAGATPAAAAAQTETPAAAPTPSAAPTPAPAPKPAQKAKAPASAPEKPAAVARPPAGEEFLVQVGAFASPDTVKEVTALLKGAGIPHFTESVATSSGPVTRVRIGPFGSREAAEIARDRVLKLAQAKGLGLKPANPVAK